MSVLTQLQIKTEIRAALGNRADFDPRYNAVINLAQVRLCRLHDFDELRGITTINTAVTADPSADKIISLASLARYRKIYSIRLIAGSASTSRKLKKILTREMDDVVPEPEFYSRRTPHSYLMWGKDQLELFPVPDQVYPMIFRFSRWPTIATDATDGQTLDLENVDDLVIHLSASYFFLLAGNTEKSNEHYKIYAALARDALGEEEEDFDTHMAGKVGQGGTIRSRGFDDPFVRSVEVPGE